jgi:hypothetical protein
MTTVWNMLLLRLQIYAIFAGNYPYCSERIMEDWVHLGYCTGTADDALSILYYQGPETLQTNLRWSRPEPPPLNPAHHVLTFQQLDIDHYTGNDVHSSTYWTCTQLMWGYWNFQYSTVNMRSVQSFQDCRFWLPLQSVQSILKYLISFSLKFKMAWHVVCILLTISCSRH